MLTPLHKCVPNLICLLLLRADRDHCLATISELPCPGPSLLPWFCSLWQRVRELPFGESHYKLSPFWIVYGSHSFFASFCSHSVYPRKAGSVTTSPCVLSLRKPHRDTEKEQGQPQDLFQPHGFNSLTVQTFQPIYTLELPPGTKQMPAMWGALLNLPTTSQFPLFSLEAINFFRLAAFKSNLWMYFHFLLSAEASLAHVALHRTGNTILILNSALHI